ncbi:hypothetical protein Scep_017283 [Stephania cephalantha]|uniref:Uncharacterized protein n=1 Tax=Stephania cephalantha TaxID=152367 RepID=A0AAP0IQ65_9MAGN
MYISERDLDQWIAQKIKRLKKMKSVLQKISAETVSAISLKSVEMNEVTPVEDYLSEKAEDLEVSPTEADIIIAQNEEEKAYMEVEIIPERPYAPYRESKEDETLVLINPPHISCIFVKFETRME